MANSLFTLLFQLMLLCDVSYEGGRTLEDTPHIPAPNITRDYPVCTADVTPKCLVVCSVPSVPQSHLSWFKGSVSLSSLMISDFNTKLYLEVNYEDNNIYSCVWSSPGINRTTYLNIHHLCQSCPDSAISVVVVKEGKSVTLSSEIQHGDDIMWFYRSTLVAEYLNNVTTYHHCDDGRFGNKLHLNTHTGSLTITNISEIHSGPYKLLITNGEKEECQVYYVSIFERSPPSYVPLIICVSVIVVSVISIVFFVLV